jgi:uncharacterized YigZ family protein
MFDDTFKTIASPAEGIYKDKGSKFIAYIYPVNSEVEIKNIIAGLKKEHHAARHHCYAYRLLPDKSIYRANDDGEPNGTAGKPILGQIQSNDLSDVLIVVVRYFGGTLLGVSGLIKAYKAAAADAILNSEIIIKTINARIEIVCTYEQVNYVMRIVKQEDLIVLKQTSNDSNITLSTEVRKSILEKVLTLLNKMEGVKCSLGS